jgi:hypothetical protein
VVVDLALLHKRISALLDLNAAVRVASDLAAANGPEAILPDDNPRAAALRNRTLNDAWVCAAGNVNTRPAVRCDR